MPMIAEVMHTHPLFFAFASVDLHNPLYKTAKQAEPQLYRLVLRRFVKNGKYIRWTLLSVLSDIKTPPIKLSMYTLQWACSSSSVGSSPSGSIFSQSHFSLTCEPMSDSSFTGATPISAYISSQSNIVGPTIGGPSTLRPSWSEMSVMVHSPVGKWNVWVSSLHLSTKKLLRHNPLLNALVLQFHQILLAPILE